MMKSKDKLKTRIAELTIWQIRICFGLWVLSIIEVQNVEPKKFKKRGIAIKIPNSEPAIKTVSENAQQDHYIYNPLASSYTYQEGLEPYNTL
jgi:hypothetical protein